MFFCTYSYFFLNLCKETILTVHTTLRTLVWVFINLFQTSVGHPVTRLEVRRISTLSYNSMHACDRDSLEFKYSDYQRQPR